MTANNILDVSEIDFELEVISHSQNRPVVVDFWAEWCKPCKVLDPILEKITMEALGTFRLARVDVDKNPTLTMRYNIRTLPSVKAIVQGEVVAEFYGMQPEIKVREFVAKMHGIVPSRLSTEKAESLLQSQQWKAAEGIFRENLDDTPSDTASLLGLAKALIAQAMPDEALLVLKAFPASRQYNQALRLLPLGDALSQLQHNRLPEDQELDPLFNNAIRLFARGKFPAAIDGLLEIMRTNRAYRNQKAHQVILGMFEILGEDNPIVREYRIELALILF